MLKLLSVCVVMACSLAMGWADNNYGKVDGLDFFSEYDETHNYAECQIFSEKYSKWWLHAEKYAQAAKRNVTLGRFAVFSDKRQGLWKFVPVEGVKNGYYLQNSLYGEKLYATSNFVGFNPFTQKRREIFTWRMSTDMQMDKKQFIWILMKDENSPDSFYLYNFQFREPLYAGSWFYKGSVYTWHQKHENHKQFRWTLDCNGKPPRYETSGNF